ncbi:RHS repeat-associated core domain-containing protein [Pseudomonas sp. S2_D06]
MSSPQKVLNCSYRYDPLDRLTSHNLSDTPERHRFYCKNRLATEIQGAIGHSIVQQGDLLLAQHQRQNGVLDSTLLATDLQRSVLNTLKSGRQPQPIAYSPYGHRTAESGLTSLLGFNGERPDPVTGHYLLGNGYRAFNPVLMRFNSPDSLSPFGKGGLNSYAYCLGDPINLGDFNGHNPFKFLRNLFKNVFKSKTPKTTPTNYHFTNKHNFSDYLGETAAPLSLNDLAMRKTENMLGAIPGRQIETLLDGPRSKGVNIWDDKTGLHNIKQHVIHSHPDTTIYEVISAGLRGELNGVLPHRANELSVLISEGKYAASHNLRPVVTPKKYNEFMMDHNRQNEIYRQAGVPLPDAFLTKFGSITVIERAKKIRFEVL